MRKRLNWFSLLNKKPKRPFFAWQIELTTRCPLSCKMCIREGHKGWQNRDMNFEDFKSLAPYLECVEKVILQGWGESLLYKNLTEIISLVKSKGSEVGFVTSGRGLDKNYIAELIKAGVDFIGFSLAGSSAKTHESIRINSDFESIVESIRTFNEIKKKKVLQTPKLHIVYLMLEENILEIPHLISLAKALDINEIFLTNLIHVTNAWQYSQTVFRCDIAHNRYADTLKRAEKIAKDLKIKLKRPNINRVDVSVCEENPLKNLYISADGKVSPCVYLNPPVDSPFKRIFCGKDYFINSLSFGNIFQEPIDDIWNKKEYIEFRHNFIIRKDRGEGFYSPLINIEELKKTETPPLPPPPEKCKTCHKMIGL